MTTALAFNPTIKTIARPRRNLEELVDRLDSGSFQGGDGDGFDPSRAEFGQEPSRGAAAQAGGRRRRGAGDPGPRGHDEDGEESGPLGLHRVDAVGEASVRRPGRDGLQPGHGPGPLRWFPTATTGRWRWQRCWGCAGGPTKWSLGAACGV